MDHIKGSVDIYDDWMWEEYGFDHNLSMVSEPDLEVRWWIKDMERYESSGS